MEGDPTRGRSTDGDREVCLCFHVSLRKLTAFLRNEKPRLPSQLSNCLGAGTGCGWCRPYLERLFRQWQDQRSSEAAAAPDWAAALNGDSADAEDTGPGSVAYAQRREAYLRQRDQQSAPTRVSTGDQGHAGEAAEGDAAGNDCGIRERDSERPGG